MAPIVSRKCFRVFGFLLIVLVCSVLVVANVSDEEMQEHYDNFFEDVFVELEDKYGEIEEMNVCDNLGDHLVGNVYIKFRREEDADRAARELNNRWFGGRPVYAELSPVTDFREACCRQYEMGECTRSGFCNFMHLKPISRELRRYLYARFKDGKGKGAGGGGRSRSRSPRGGPGGGGSGPGVRRSRSPRRAAASGGGGGGKGISNVHELESTIKLRHFSGGDRGQGGGDRGQGGGDRGQGGGNRGQGGGGGKHKREDSVE